MPNSSSLQMLMNVQQTSQGTFGTHTMFRKSGSLIKSVRLHLPVLLGFGLNTRPSTSLVGLSTSHRFDAWSFLGQNLMSSARTISIPPSPLDNSKPRTKKFDRSSKNRHKPPTSVHESILPLQQHQLRRVSRVCARTQTILISSNSQGVLQVHPLAKAGWERAVSNSSSQGRGDGNGVDVVIGLIGLFVPYSSCRESFLFSHSFDCTVWRDFVSSS